MQKLPFTLGPVVALDFESYYDKEVGLENLGSWHYCRHPKAVPYLLSVFDGVNKWIGDPAEFDWLALTGRTLLSHNASFDEEMYLACCEMRGYPKVHYKEWICTADLAVWNTGWRDLKGAVKEAFGVELSKQVRSDAKGKNREDFEREGSWQAMLDYAGDDAIWCWKLWEKYYSLWPEMERELSQVNRRNGRYGVRVNVPELRRCISLCRAIIVNAETDLPWIGRGRKPASTIGRDEECRKAGIPPPPVKSGPNGDPEAAEEWLDLYGKTYPWVAALKRIRQAKKMLATLETMLSRVRADDTVPIYMFYYGAHTGRFAAAGGLNFLNLNKETLFADIDPDGKGIDIRGLLIPREGKRFAIVDLSQIEPRLLNWLIGNEELLGMIREGMAIYEAHARRSMGWTGGELKRENKKFYALAKAQVLALGYGAGWEKFITMALHPMYGNLDLCADDDKVALEASINGVIYCDEPRVIEGKKMLVPAEFDPALTAHQTEKVIASKFVLVNDADGVPTRELVYGINARRIVADFRKNNPLITGLWKQLDDDLREAAYRERDHIVEFPGGSKMMYRNCRYETRRKLNKKTGEWYTKREVRFDRGSKSEGTYGGKATENCLAGCTEVYTNRGWTTLDSVRVTDLVFDGVEFVRHGGLVCKGEQQTINVLGVWATPDHRFLTSANEWLSAQELRDGRLREALRVFPDSPEAEAPATTEECLSEVYDLLNCGPRSRFVVRGHAGGPAVIAHNCIQHLAREVFLRCFLSADRAGHVGLWSVYDEGIHEVDDDGSPLWIDAGETKQRFVLTKPDDTTALGKVMKHYVVAPDWATGLPVAAEGVWADQYLK